MGTGATAPPFPPSETKHRERLKASSGLTAYRMKKKKLGGFPTLKTRKAISDLKIRVRVSNLENLKSIENQRFTTLSNSLRTAFFYSYPFNVFFDLKEKRLVKHIALRVVSLFPCFVFCCVCFVSFYCSVLFCSVCPITIKKVV